MNFALTLRFLTGKETMKKRELVLISILTVIIAVMDITGIPGVFFIDIHIADIEPVYFALMINHIFIGIIAFLFLKFLCPEWRLGVTTQKLSFGLKKYGAIGVIAAVIGLIAFYVGLMPFDFQPSAAKVIVEGVVYYIGVAVIEELYVRGLLLNIIEKLFYKNQSNTLIAVVLSSLIFGLGHIFGALGQSALVIVSRVIWTVGMGLFFGMIYKKTNNLWLPVIIHFLINVCALPYCFSSVSGYADLTLYIMLPTYILLGTYSLIELKNRT